MPEQPFLDPINKVRSLALGYAHQLLLDLLQVGATPWAEVAALVQEGWSVRVCVGPSEPGDGVPGLSDTDREVVAFLALLGAGRGDPHASGPGREAGRDWPADGDHQGIQRAVWWGHRPPDGKKGRGRGAGAVDLDVGLANLLAARAFGPGLPQSTLAGRAGGISLTPVNYRAFSLASPAGRGRIPAADTELPEVRARHAPSRQHPPRAPPGRAWSSYPGRVGLTSWSG
jgi:hypothetical protein